MPRLTAATPKYCLHRASGQAIVTIAGKDHYLGPWKSKASRVEYDRLVGEWLAAGRPTAPPKQQHEVKVVELCATFIQYAKAYYRKHGRSTGTAENYRYALQLLRRRYGHTNAVDFGPLALKALRLVMIEAGHSRTYVNGNIAKICRVFRWAASEQKIPASVPQNLGTVDGLRKGHSEAKENAPILPVDDAVVEATLPHMTIVVRDMVKLQRLTGARPSEICSLRPCDVERNADVWRYVPREHKTEHHAKRRTILIGPKAQAFLLPYLLRDTETCCFSPIASMREMRERRHQQRRTPLSCGDSPGTKRVRKPRRKPSEGYGVDAYRRAITRACEVAFNMPEELRKANTSKETAEKKAKLLELAREWRAANCWSPNQLRHTAATEVRKLHGLEVAQLVLGHSRADVTQIYAARDMEKASMIVKQMG